MLQNPCKTLGFKKNMVYKIPPGGGEVNHIQPVAYNIHVCVCVRMCVRAYGRVCARVCVCQQWRQVRETFWSIQMCTLVFV